MQIEGKDVIAFIDELPRAGYISLLDNSFQEFPMPRVDPVDMLQKEMRRAGQMIRDLQAEIDALKASK